MNKFPSETNIGVLTLTGPKPVQTGLTSVDISLMPGTANTAAGIIAELSTRYRGQEPALYSLWVSTTDGSIWQHQTAGMVAADWVCVVSPNLTASILASGVTQADLVKLHAITATAAHLNSL